MDCLKYFLMSQTCFSALFIRNSIPQDLTPKHNALMSNMANGFIAVGILSLSTKAMEITTTDGWCGGGGFPHFHYCVSPLQPPLAMSNSTTHQLSSLANCRVNGKTQFIQRSRGSDIGRRLGAFSSPSHVNKCVNAYRGDEVGARHSEASAASVSSPEWRLKATRGVWLKRKCVTILNLILNFLKRLKSIHHYTTSIAQIIGGTFYKNSENSPDTCSILSSHGICHTSFPFFNHKGCTQNLCFLILASCMRGRASSSSEEDVMKAVQRGSVARVIDSSVCFAHVTSAPCLCPTSEPRLLCMNWA
jgi:hypothetical protein